jgi:hypothetical protein
MEVIFKKKLNLNTEFVDRIYKKKSNAIFWSLCDKKGQFEKKTAYIKIINCVVSYVYMWHNKWVFWRNNFPTKHLTSKRNLNIGKPNKKKNYFF